MPFVHGSRAPGLRLTRRPRRYSLASVIVTANLMAMRVHLFAKVGVATELNIPELCRWRVGVPPLCAANGQGAPGRGSTSGTPRGRALLAGLWPVG
jgi:hypothetical protein